MFYGSLTKLPSNQATVSLCNVPFKGYQQANMAYMTTGTYAPRTDSSVWLNDDGLSLILYKPTSLTACFISGTYMMANTN